MAVLGDFDEDSRPRRDELVSILEEGSATMVSISQAMVIGVHFVLTKASRSATHPKIKQLNEAGLCIVAPQFVVEWLAHPWQLPSKVRQQPQGDPNPSSWGKSGM